MFKAKLTKDTGESVTITLPQSYPRLSSEMASLGERLWPEHISMDGSGEVVRGELIPTSEIGKHLMHLFPEEYTLEDANDMAHIVTQANNLIKEDLEQNILHDQYCTAQELWDGIRQMTFDAGTVSKTYYFPLTGKMWDEEYGEELPAGKRFLLGQEDAIREKFAEYTRRDTDNMSVYFHEIGADKLLLADWGFEVLDDELYGKVDVRLTELMTEEEESELRDWIRGQNSDGLGESFEQREISTDRGDLYLSFWDSGEGYFVKDSEEMDEYLGHSGQQFGGME